MKKKSVARLTGTFRLVLGDAGALFCPASSCRRASRIDGNQFTLRHSSLKLPLNDSTKVLLPSVVIPGMNPNEYLNGDLKTRVHSDMPAGTEQELKQNSILHENVGQEAAPYPHVAPPPA
jgi:hypothetical protein